MIKIPVVILLAIGVIACQNQTTTTNINQAISIDDFEQKIANLPDVQLIDVRTPGEFAQEHLVNALNININSPDFIDQMNQLDKSKPVLIYCLSGVRSNKAARQMQQAGFKEVYNMQGGLLKWRNAGKSLNVSAGKAKGMSTKDFDNLITTDKYVLVDYNAKWCEPCRRMLPILESFAVQRQDKLTLLKVDADENKDLLQEKGIESIPYLELYQNGRLVWKYRGFIDAPTLRQETQL